MEMDNSNLPDVSRLPTFKGPRDLTLSRGARSRKHYTPNIPPKRDKSVTDTSTNPTSTAPVQPQFAQPALPGPSELRLRFARPNVQAGLGLYGQGPRSRGPRPPLLQSPSIFSEGVGIKSATPRKTISSIGRGGRGSGTGLGSSKSSTGTSELQKVIKKNLSKSKTSPEEDISIDISEDEPIGGFGSFIEDLYQGPLPRSLHPVSLPLSGYLEKAAVSRSRSKLKKNKNTKPVPGDCFSNFVNSASMNTLVYLQLPDKLPFLKRGVKITKEEGSKIREDDVQCDLASVRGGQIGKIQILASGRARLLLGQHSKPCTFEIESSFAIPFRQELAAVNTKTKSITVLGKVQHKFICIPELDTLFKQIL